MTRVRSNKPGKYWRDKGHLRRKAVFYAYAVLTLPVQLAASAADAFDKYVYDPVVYRGHKIHAWANPCLYKEREK